MCFSLPAVRALAVRNRLQILCPEAQSAFWTAAGFKELIPYPEGSSVRRIASLLQEPSRALLWEAGTAAEACAKANVPERLGLPAPKLAKYLTEALERRINPGPPEHQVQRFLDTAALLGADPFKREHFGPISSKLARDSETVLVIPGSDFGPNYEWPLDHWAEVVTYIKGLDHHVKIGVTGTGECGRELANVSGCEALPLDPTVPDLLATVGLCLAADSSLPHLAAALGTTCAVLFGPADPALIRPLGRRHLVIRRKVECAPCFLNYCPFDYRCQHDLSVERVLKKLSVFSEA